ncbi:uncharacterized protein LOC124297269 [Neodiprion virginianus]|uniref:uncharacterized protein LOC124297269 n=1 Tax=Neodiprion virginianus TaxID=2961670 RepID=UPI001EE74248|nr:uncharacterized protein LOC124297269 [Neodiprion virginianus]
MDFRIRTGFQGNTHSINFNPQSEVKAKVLSTTHVVRVEEVSGVTEACKLIRASVIRQTSVTLAPYKVQIELNYERHPINVACTCVSQAGLKCKHIYALIRRINTDRSTSKPTVEQEWGRPSDLQLGKKIYAKPIVVTDVVD